MGYYINPKDMSKEKWLGTNASAITDCPQPYKKIEGEHWVCLVDNGAFTAAGVAYDEAEYAAFNRENDQRPRAWASIPDEKLLEVEPLLKGVLA